MMYKSAFALAALVVVASAAPFKTSPRMVVPGAQFSDDNEKRQCVFREDPNRLRETP